MPVCTWSPKRGLRGAAGRAGERREPCAVRVIARPNAEAAAQATTPPQIIFQIFPLPDRPTVAHLFLIISFSTQFALTLISQIPNSRRENPVSSDG